MRVLFINQYYRPDPASTGQLLSELATDLSRRFEVTVVTGFPCYLGRKGCPRPLAIERAGGVKVVRTFSTAFSRRSNLGRMLNYLTFFFSSLWACLVTAGRTDVVLTMTDPPVIALAGYLVSRFHRSRFVYISQDVFPEVGNVLGVIRPGAVSGFLSRLNRFLLSRADRVVAIGRDMERRLLAKGAPRERIRVIENWVDTEAIHPVARRNPLAARHRLDRHFVVMHSGNVGLSQDLDTVLGAARLLRDRPDVLFVIVGDGVARARLEARADRLGLYNLRFLPYQDLRDLKYSLASADVSLVTLKRGLAGYIVPSKLAGIMASGRPVLAAVEPECEVARVVRKAHCGVVIDPGDPVKLARAVEYLREDPRLLELQGRNARNAALARFSRQRAAEEYRDMIFELAPAGMAPGEHPGRDSRTEGERIAPLEEVWR
jgi:glycosyltransferase involved in cell wall biosynthesis